MTPGRFLTLEGGEGAGKSTQLRRLAAVLADRGLDVVVTREPGGSEGAEAIRSLLMDGAADRWSARAEALLFAAARADHIERLIRPALDRGAWVLCDRYVDSTRAYQGAQGIDDAAIMSLHRFGSQGLLPDRTLVLRIDVEEGARRAEARDAGALDRFAQRGRDFHESVAAAFARIAAGEPERVRLIDASATPQVVTDRLLAAISDLLP
ncbi:thymidylate kinase [Sphingomonas guangdongensis]|uniref:Thymidylate kinase n=1 Tax=Sphingomonas guangdongensis TaxID=1141890 RepID=A0A285R180_9SPHN|nr:dTMP kinase [Sphingomonas guangdongensis]SOB87851.1 thymidylate kinase [Sphingomonas guangdongensis]